MRPNGDSVYRTQKCRFPHGNVGTFTCRDHTLYTIIYFWPGESMTVGGVKFKGHSAHFLATGLPVKFTQRGSQLIFSGLPAHPPGDPLTVIFAECDSEPVRRRFHRKQIHRGSRKPQASLFPGK